MLSGFGYGYGFNRDKKKAPNAGLLFKSKSINSSSPLFFLKKIKAKKVKEICADICRHHFILLLQT